MAEHSGREAAAGMALAAAGRAGVCRKRPLVALGCGGRGASAVSSHGSAIPSPRRNLRLRSNSRLTAGYSTESPVDTPAVSPDGSQLALRGAKCAGVQSLWVHRFDRELVTPLPYTEGAKSPFWSADGRWIGFHADGKLSKIRPSGGRPQKIADVPSFRVRPGVPAGDIVFGAGPRTPLFHVHESGGTPVQITNLDLSRRENSHRYPVFLPDGKHFLFTARCSRAKTVRCILAPSSLTIVCGLPGCNPTFRSCRGMAGAAP